MNRVTSILLKSYLSRPRTLPGRGGLPSAAQQQPGNANAGVTLLEALVAMLVITFTLAVITPPIFMATATRVSNQRTEQAMQLAQGEIERVRLLMLGGDPYVTINPQLPPIQAGAQKATVDEVGAPTSLCTPPAGIPTAAPCTALQLVQTANESLYIQTFREDGATVPSGDVVAFRMGVRVYGSEALDVVGQAGALLTEPSNIKFTSGAGSRVNRPLVVFYTEMIRGTEGNALNAMRNTANWD
jgi:type II secretory pathway pseudopilin PulG